MGMERETGRYGESGTYGTHDNPQSYTQPQHQGAEAYDSPRVLSATTVIGDDVRNQAGDDLGQVKEIMLDINAGRVAYAVLSFGGFMGMGDKLFAVPWEAMTLDTEQRAFILNVDRQTLENAPGFDKDNWPKTTAGDDTWLREVYDYYGYGPYWR